MIKISAEEVSNFTELRNEQNNPAVLFLERVQKHLVVIKYLWASQV